MKIVTATLIGKSPMSQSRAIQVAKETGESHDAYEQRTWRERLHTDKGRVIVPASALKNMLGDIAKFLGESIPGKGKATWTKHYEAGVMVVEPMVLNVATKDVQGERLFVPASGKRGDGKRVWKTFPLIPEGWQGQAQFLVMDPQILGDLDMHAKDVAKSAFVRHLSHAGKFIGLGRFRPRNNGFYGRFAVDGIEISNVTE